MTERWPELDFAAQRPVIESLHAYLQVIGKLPTRSLPWCNHSWHLALRVVPRGFRSYPVFAQNGEAEATIRPSGSRHRRALPKASQLPARALRNSMTS